MNVITKNLPRDVFLYLLSIITLVASAVSFGILVFQYINVYFSDLISDYYAAPSAYYGSIRQALATLIVIFPVYLWMSWFLKRDINDNPEKRELKIRKWLLYLTVFAAALVVIGDLIALIRTFLDGELTIRFILKVLTIFFIAGSVFSYYYFELKDLGPKGKHLNVMRVYSWTVIGVVVVAIISGFFIAGSPQNRRLVRFDERRVNDLSLIQGQVINYWQRKDHLPVSLNDLSNDILGITIPKDPKTNLSYEYRSIANLKFELCATFETASEDIIDSNGRSKPVPAAYPYPGNETWKHGLERTCFERTIDPELFKPANKSYRL